MKMYFQFLYNWTRGLTIRLSNKRSDIGKAYVYRKGMSQVFQTLASKM